MISWEYLAGIIDGEGSIGTTKTGYPPNIVGRVIVANTDLRLLTALNEFFGGYMTVRSKGQKSNWKPFATLTWTGRQAEKILVGARPFLIIKGEQADLCLELIRMRDVSKDIRCERVTITAVDGRKVPSLRLRPEIREQEEALAAEIRRLNTKGVKVEG